MLDEDFTKIKSEVSHRINTAPILNLQSVGWSNLRNDSITNYVLQIGIHTTSRHTAEFLSSKMEKILVEIGINTFLGIISDNGANIKCARKIVVEKYNHLIEYGCICHALNNLIEDVLKLVDMTKFKTEASSIVADIKNSQILNSTFKQIQMDEINTFISLKLMVKTRW